MTDPTPKTPPPTREDFDEVLTYLEWCGYEETSPSAADYELCPVCRERRVYGHEDGCVFLSLSAYTDALEAERDHYRAEALRLGVLVKECDLQLRYLHEKFPTTGTTEQLLTKTAAIDEELASLTVKPEADTIKEDG